MKPNLKFSFETPIKYLKALDESQDYLFILAGHLENLEYFTYCKNSKKFKILDNMAYENGVNGESISPTKLLFLAHEINANVIVLPDKLFDKERSEELQKDFYLHFTKYDRKKFKLMKVVTGNNESEYLQSLEEVSGDKRVDIIGISKSRCLITPNLSFVMNYLREIKNKKQIHLLGLEHPFELEQARYYEEIKTIDTGLPINFAFKNLSFPIIKRFDEFKRVSGEDIDTNKKLDIELAKKNIEILKNYYY